MTLPPVLDVCRGPRMMWFDKQDQRALFGDQRPLFGQVSGTKGMTHWLVFMKGGEA